MFRQNFLDNEKSKIAFIFAGVSASSNAVAKGAAEDFNKNGIRSIMFTIIQILELLASKGLLLKHL